MQCGLLMDVYRADGEVWKCRPSQVLRVRFSKDSASSSDPMQHTAPLGSPSDCLPAVQLGPEAAADMRVSDGVCHILPGASSFTDVFVMQPCALRFCFLQRPG